VPIKKNEHRSCRSEGTSFVVWENAGKRREQTPPQEDTDMTTNAFYTTDAAAKTTMSPLRSKATRYAPATARTVLGLVFFVFGLNGFLSFIPPPPEPMPEGAVALGTAFMSSGYLFQLIKGTEVLGGLLLLCARFVPLGLVLLAPIVVNILAFHLWLLPSGTGFSLLLVGLELYLAWAYRQAFAPLLAARAQPAGR
jgi:uncharacterized membrane protein YphA (DoxX/SURF4 family)